MDHGVTSTADVIESPEHLCGCIIEHIHLFTLSMMLSVDKWMAAIRKDMERDETATKHYQHIRVLDEQLSLLKRYAIPIHEAFQFMLERQDIENSDSDEESDNDLDRSRRRGKSIGSIKSLRKNKSKPADMVIEKEKLEMHFISNYIGKPALENVFFPLVYGTSVDLESENDNAKSIKGTSFWMHELNKYDDEIKSLRDLYSQSLDEKRNFLTFALTFVTILLTPMAVMTGYW